MNDLAKKIKNYQPAAAAHSLLKEVPILLLVGPTGSGKSTLEKELLKTNRFKLVITHTTRPPRLNRGYLEKDAIDYYFISPAQAIDMMAKQEFIEVALTHDHLYGTSLKAIQAAAKNNKVPMAAIDIKGVRSYRRLSNGVIAIFLLPPSFEVLLSRLKDRYGDSKNATADIRLRLATALSELSDVLAGDYNYLVINQDIKLAAQVILGVVDSGEVRAADPRALELARSLITAIEEYLRKA